MQIQRAHLKALLRVHGFLCHLGQSVAISLSFLRIAKLPKDAEDVLFEMVESATNKLEAKGYKDNEIVVGFLDEASHQSNNGLDLSTTFSAPMMIRSINSLQVGISSMRPQT